MGGIVKKREVSNAMKAVIILHSPQTPYSASFEQTCRRRTLLPQTPYSASFEQTCGRRILLLIGQT